MATIRNKRKVRMGWVISDKMNKTIVVAMQRLRKHSRYGKVLRRTTKLYVHDEQNQCQVGDKIKIIETRPFSRLKRWRLVEILEKARIGAKEKIKEEFE